MLLDQGRLRSGGEGTGWLVEESWFGEESRIRRFNLVCRYLGTTADYPENKVVGQNLIFGREPLSVVDFFFFFFKNVGKPTKMP